MPTQTSRREDIDSSYLRRGIKSWDSLHKPWAVVLTAPSTFVHQDPRSDIVVTGTCQC
jgi:hypothetical protein